jgi:hypothetical protein
MKTIHVAQSPCPCFRKLRDYTNGREELLRIGSIVECDCGKRFVYAEDQRDGFYWRQVAA